MEHNSQHFQRCAMVSKLPAFIITDGKGPGFLYLGHQVEAAGEIEFNKGTITLDQVAEETTRTKHRIHIYRLEQTPNGIRGVYIDHRVNMRSILQTTNCIPRYLFRAYSSRSGGFNSVGLFKSQAAKNGRSLDVESLTEAQMVAQLRNHVNHNRKFESHLISFSLSFMWVLRRALVLKEKGHEHVRIAMIDTWDIPADTWVRHAHSMLKGYGVEQELMLKNLGQGEIFVWDKLHVTMNVARLDDMLKAGLLTLLPFYRKPNVDHVTISKSKKSQWKLPNVIRTQIFKHLTDSKALVRKINEDMAPKTFQEKYVAGRSFYKKNFRVWWLKNKYIPISCRTLIHFVTFVETFFATKYQFPMLIILFSLRLDVIEFTDIIDCMRYLQDRPMMSGLEQCFKGKYRRGLKELESFEWLLEQCANTLGIPCRTFQDWHEPRFTMPRAQHLYTMLPFLTARARRKFESVVRQELERKRDAQLDQGSEQKAGQDIKQSVATSKCGGQFVICGKRKANIELDKAGVKKSRTNEMKTAELENFVTNILNKMGTVNISGISIS